MPRPLPHMRFDDRFLAELKARVRPSDVIGRRVKLRRRGREFVGLSPFNPEKTPSFYVNDDKGMFFDHSSGKNGDLITFLREADRMSFAEAVAFLAAEAGMPLPASDPAAAEQDRLRAQLADWLARAAAWFTAELHAPGGRSARLYLQRRGLPEAEWGRFGLGFAPTGRTRLKDHFVGQGAPPALLVAAGLLIEPAGGGAPFDRFRDRIMFPIADARGRLVSFGGRALDAAATAKYLNGPETELFHKGHVLYGLPEARRLLASSSHGAAPLVVVEGYLDVIAGQRAGLATVAPLGTALTETQMELLWRLHHEPTLCLDDDPAGRRAAGRVIERALPILRPGRSFSFARITGGKDPDQVMREQGPDVLKAQVADTIPLVEALFARERDVEPLDTPERRAGLKQRLRAAAERIADPDLAQAYRADLQARFEGLALGRGPRAAAGAASGQAGAIRERPRPFQAAVALAALDHTDWIAAQESALDRVGFGDPRLAPLAAWLSDFLAGHDPATSARTRLAEQGFGPLLIELAAAAAAVSAPFLDPKQDREAARRIWEACYGAVVEIADSEQALTALRRTAVTAGTLAASRDLRDRVMLLQRRISGLAFW